MKGIGVILRSFFISPEFLVIVAGLMLSALFPNRFLWLSERIGSHSDLLKYSGLLPAGLVAYSLKVARSILLPDADKRTVLQGWPRYWEVKCGVGIGMVYSVAFALAGIVTMLFDWKNPMPFQSAVLLTSVTGAVTVSASLFYANIRVEELFREHWKQKPSV